MKKILVIEDDPVVAHIYRNRLEKEGYTVEVCEDGQAGFYRIHEFHPHGILLDLMLPGLSGKEVCQAISEPSPESLRGEPAASALVPSSGGNRALKSESASCVGSSAVANPAISA